MTAPVRSVEGMLALIRQGQVDRFLALAPDLEPADLADVLAQLDELERIRIVRRLPADVSAEALVEMPEAAHAEDTLAELEPEEAAEIVEEMEDDDAADLLGTLEPEDQERILAEVEDRADVDRLLRYDEESAGGLMTAQVVAVPLEATVGEALDLVRRQAEEVPDVHQVFVVDPDRRLVGLLDFKALVVSAADRLVRDVMDPADLFVRPDADQEEVARLMSRYNLSSLAVVDDRGVLLGRITVDDIIDVVEAEATEDVLRFGGVSADEDLAGTWRTAVPSRLTWLSINLLTAFLAASVVVLFQDAIARTIALAAWMPIIAGMGGNAGTQTLAVTVRRLAMGQLRPRESVAIFTKELTLGAVNGLVLGLVVGLVATTIGQGWQLGLVVFLAMAGNLVVASLSGAFIPLLLHRLRVDPAIASSVFVTTFTDMAGFALLLGLAGLLLL